MIHSYGLSQFRNFCYEIVTYLQEVEKRYTRRSQCTLHPLYRVLLSDETRHNIQYENQEIAIITIH